MIIAAGQFKARCLELLDRVNRSHEEVIISKRGKPVARLVALSDAPARSIYGYMAGTVLSQGDIVSPVGEAWDADK
jgi:prevent-host-death family protein